MNTRSQLGWKTVSKEFEGLEHPRVSCEGRKCRVFDSLPALRKEHMSLATESAQLQGGNFISVLLDEVSNGAPRGSPTLAGLRPRGSLGPLPTVSPSQSHCPHFPRSSFRTQGPCLPPESCCGGSLVKPSRSVSL